MLRRLEPVFIPFIALAFLFLAAVPSWSIERIDHSEGGTLPAKQWEVVDVRFHVASVSQSPFAVDFRATFSSKSGKRLKVAGFYDGGKTFVLRFTPPTAEEWSYVTESSVQELDGKSGTLKSIAAAPNRKGGIVIAPESPTRFRYENGEAYYPIAFECDWLFALDGDNEADIPDTRKFVDQLAQNGFNQIVMNVYAHDVNWKKDDRLLPKHEYGSPRIFPFGGDNGSPDYSTLSVSYFQRLDRVIDYLDQKGIAAHLMIYVWNKRVNWPDAGSEADNRYFDYVAKRYQAFPNLVWDISKEALGYGHTDVHYITDRIHRLRERDVYDRLITVHDYSYCRRFVEEVDFVSVQLWLSELYGVMRKVCREMPGKPILNIEHGGYERGPYVVFNGNYTSPEVCLQRAYQCVFAGTYPTHYWQGAAWNVIVPDMDSLPPAARPRLEYYRHMRKLVDQFKIDELTAGDKRSNAGFCLHNGKDLYLYYVPKECDFVGLRLKEFQGGQMSVQWFNPVDGSYSEPEKKSIPQWPAVKAPSDGGFHILIVRILDSKSS